MKKIIFSAVLVMAAAISFNSCVKKAVKPNATIESSTPVAQQLNICPLSNISAPDYYSLGNALFGNLNGQGTIGAIDTKLNCNQSAGTLCYNVTSTDIMVCSFSEDPMEGWNYLSDGVMTVTEQQSVISQVQNDVNAHMASTYGAGYIVTNYDVWFMTALCGGCPDGIVVMVKYKAGKPCR